MSGTRKSNQSRRELDLLAAIGEPCVHGNSPVVCQTCTDDMIATLPELRDFRCREHLVGDMRVVKVHCGHAAGLGKFGPALVCEACGWAGHKWSGFACGRSRPKPEELALEQALCPIRQRMSDQKRQVVAG